MARAMSRVKRSADIHSVKKALEAFARSCTVLATPSTPLLKATYDDCRSTVAFLREFAAVPRALRSCGAPVTQAAFTPTARPDLACFKKILRGMKARTETAIKTSTAVNQALAERDIQGRCRRVIGTSQKDLRSLHEIAATTDELDRATDSPNPRRVNRAVRRFENALDKLLSGPDEPSLKLLRACRP